MTTFDDGNVSSATPGALLHAALSDSLDNWHNLEQKLRGTVAVAAGAPTETTLIGRTGEKPRDATGRPTLRAICEPNKSTSDGKFGFRFRTDRWNIKDANRPSHDERSRVSDFLAGNLENFERRRHLLAAGGNIDFLDEKKIGKNVKMNENSRKLNGN